MVTLKILNLQQTMNMTLTQQHFRFGNVFVSGSNPSRPRKPTAISLDTEVKMDDIIDRDDLDFGAPLFHGLPGRKQHGPPYNTRNSDDPMLR